MAKCDFDDCISRISSTTRLDSGTNTASRVNPRMSVSFGLRSCAANRSFERTSPMTSSTVSPNYRSKAKSTITAELPYRQAFKGHHVGTGTIAADNGVT